MIPVQNTVLSSTFDFWRNRTNEMANYFSTCAVTTDANGSTVAATGNAEITGTFTANSISVGNSTVNAVILTDSPNNVFLVLSNSSVNTQLSVPTAGQYDNNFHLAANGEWTFVSVSNNISNYDGTNIKEIDSFKVVEYNAAEYLLSVKDRSFGGNGYFTSKVLVTHNTADAFITEYAQFTTNNALGTFTVGTDTGRVVLYFTPTVANVQVKFVRTIV